MKKFISVLLALILICGSAFTAGVYAQEDKSELCFAVASDVHYVTPAKTATSTPYNEGVKPPSNRARTRFITKAALSSTSFWISAQKIPSVGLF